MLEVQRLTRYYGALAAAIDVSFSVGSGEARWPLFLGVGVLFLQFVPWIVRMLLAAHIYWLAPAFFAAIAASLRVTHPPEPPLLVDADHQNKPLALRLY